MIGGHADQLAKIGILEIGSGRDSDVAVKFADAFQKSSGIGQFGSALEAEIYVIPAGDDRTEGFLESARESEGVDDCIRNVVNGFACGGDFGEDDRSRGQEQLAHRWIVAR